MNRIIFVTFIFLGISLSAFAQRVSYPELVQRTERPEIFIDHFQLPGDGEKTNLVFTFRFNNDFIPYRKIPLQNNLNAPAEAGFYSTIRLNSEIFEGKLKRRGEPSANSVSRDIWTDTLFTTNFEDTQSAELYAAGALTAQLKPGNYNFILQLSLLQERNERSTQRRDIKIHDLTEKKTGEIILIRDEADTQEGRILELMNLEDNVPFGEDFIALIRIPGYKESDEYQTKVHKAIASERDTTASTEIYSAPLNPDDVYPGANVRLTSESEKNDPSLILSQSDAPYTYAVISIPASEFENSLYQLSLTKNGQEKPVAIDYFRSYWPDMPASLYNLNIAIDHLEYMISEDEVKRIKKGNNREKEQKFREFWEQRDPSPNTVYNELMAEYYRRIDYAFKEFGSQENPMGHESDQGEIYIKFGPPNGKERVFPPGGKTREIWKYPNRTFVFEATTGFGDFELVGTK